MSVRHNALLKNFSKPDGALGKSVGTYMELEYYEVNCWAIEQLNVRMDDNILEIGFGPGIAIEKLAQLAPNGHIAGIDYSELMVRKARKRNEPAIREGHVDLQHANVSQLPNFDKSFDKILAINNIMYWEQPIAVLKNLKKMLHPGGTITVIIQRASDAVKSGYCNHEIGWYVHCLVQAGFYEVRVASQPVNKEARNSMTHKMVDFAMYGNYPKQTTAGICITGISPTLLCMNTQPNVLYYWDNEQYQCQSL